jgi:hypothetical protein
MLFYCNRVVFFNKGLKMLQSLKKSLKEEAHQILKDLSGHTSGVILLITLIMLIIEFYGWQGPFHKFIAPYLKRHMKWREVQLMAQLYTTLNFWLFFLVVPAIYLKGTKAQESLQGLRWPKLIEFKIYGVFAIFMIGILSGICSRPSFYNFYPLFRPTSFTEWLTFEAIYLPQFIAVEFFFRGPLLFFLAEKMQRTAIYFMTLPYAIIHIHKPFPEALASILAGVILCHFALKTRSIWPGVILHMIVALGADFFGLAYSGTMMRWF